MTHSQQPISPMTNHPTKPHLLIILGPTAVGKSDLAVELAQKFNGEIISADSRQVYRGLDIGTGKITREEMKGIPHHLLDVTDPRDRFDVTTYVKLATQAITDIISRGKLPIICGGTGFYIHALVDGVTLPDVKPDEALRAELDTYELSHLVARLETLDPERLDDMRATGDDRNKRRIIRAIEIATALGTVPKIVQNESSYDTCFIGLTVPADELKTRIRSRLMRRIEAGMIEEAQRLHSEGLSYGRMNELGLEYRYEADLLQGKLSREEFIDTLSAKIWQYAKRQMTWFKRDGRIRWCEVHDMKKIEVIVRECIGI